MLRAGERAYNSPANPDRKVAILGAAGGIGQPLSLLMKVKFPCCIYGDTGCAATSQIY